MPSDGYKQLLKRYEASGIVWAIVDLVPAFSASLLRHLYCRPFLLLLSSASYVCVT